VTLGDRKIAPGARNCLDRWNQIDAILKQYNARSLLDLGCAEGFFIQEAARSGLVALGIDADVRRLTVAQNMTMIDRVARAGFLYAEIDAPFIESLPNFDVTLFLSILHHIIYGEGLDTARKIMAAIHKITNIGVVFDMGQSNEISHEWSELLPRMDPNPRVWISNFLTEVGFSEVRVLQSTDAYMSGIRRELFWCIK